MQAPTDNGDDNVTTQDIQAIQIIHTDDVEMETIEQKFENFKPIDSRDEETSGSAKQSLAQLDEEET
jgi:hypothetical protein